MPKIIGQSVTGLRNSGWRRIGLSTLRKICIVTRSGAWILLLYIVGMRQRRKYSSLWKNILKSCLKQRLWGTIIPTIEKRLSSNLGTFICLFYNYLRLLKILMHMFPKISYFLPNWGKCVWQNLHVHVYFIDAYVWIHMFKILMHMFLSAHMVATPCICLFHWCICFDSCVWNLIAYIFQQFLTFFPI